MLALAVDISEAFAKSGQGFQWDESPIDAADVLAVSVDLSREDKLAVLGIVRGDLSNEGSNTLLCCLIQSKDSFDARPTRTRTNEAGVRTVTQKEPESVNDDRFTRTSLASEHVQSRIQGHFRVLDYAKVSDGQESQHDSITSYLARRY